MENLSLHIEYLLLRHDCVIVPGIGAFINIYQAPSFDTATGRILPPSREIRFNSALRSDDGMLANSIARKLGIPYREGSEILAKIVDELGHTLLKEQEATIGRLGIIRRETEGNIRFYPFKSAERCCIDSGLVSVPFVSTSPHASIDDTQKTINSSNPPLVESVAEDFSHPVETISNKKDGGNNNERKLDFERNYYFPINKTAIKGCACLLVIAFFAVLGINQPFNSNKSEERASVIPLDKVIDSAMQISHGEKNISEDTDNLAEPTPGENDTLKLAEEDQFYLIVASCISANEADRFMKAKANASSAYDLKIIKSNKLFRVAAKSSNNRQELVDTMRSQKFKNIFSESWIWEKPL